MSTISSGQTETVGLAGAGNTASPGAGERIRRRLIMGWFFAHHLLEMVIAMLVGMAALIAAIALLGTPPGYGNPLVEYGLMGAAMTMPMVAWMRHRGHPWSDGAEMTAAMLLPMFASVFLMVLGIARLDGHALMMLTHISMIAGMVALMLYRRDRYTHGPRRHS